MRIKNDSFLRGFDWYRFPCLTQFQDEWMIVGELTKRYRFDYEDGSSRETAIIVAKDSTREKTLEKFKRYLNQTV